MRIVSWNVGSYYFLNYAVNHRLSYHGTPIESIYFQPTLNGEFVSNNLASFDPDIMFLQEISHLEEVQNLPVLDAYPHRTLLPNVHHEHSILVAAKEAIEQTSAHGFNLITFQGINFLPIHLNAHHAAARLADAALIAEIAKNSQRFVVIGDTNLWSWGRHAAMPKDRKAYEALTRHLLDATVKIHSTSLFGFAFDKAFVSPDLQVEHAQSPRLRSHFMDHYPLVIDVQGYYQ